MPNLHVTTTPSSLGFADFATDPNLAGIRMNGILFESCNTEKEFSLIPPNSTVPLWLDAKGRQLRIVESIRHKTHLELVLNHKISGIELPHEIIFKAGEDWATIERITDDGKRLHMRSDGLPRYWVNPGDSIHLRDRNLEINEALFTDVEKERIALAVQAGHKNFYLSYVECQADVDEFRELVGKDANLILKIENLKGLRFVETEFKKEENVRLAAARGDLYVEVFQPHHIVAAQKLIVEKDPEALAGSRMLLSLFNNLVPACSDICELELLQNTGFKSFLLCDDLCKKESSLKRAIKIFTQLTNQ